MYGPMPTMSVIAKAVAWTSPSSRRKVGLSLASANLHQLSLVSRQPSAFSNSPTIS
jgi:hypothetical protein